MSRRTTAWWRSDLTYAERLCDGGFVRSNSRSRSPSTFMVVAFILNLYQNECAKQAVIASATGGHSRASGPLWHWPRHSRAAWPISSFSSATADRVDSVRAGGWDLGLTLVHGCAEAHGGRVRVDSDAATGTTLLWGSPLIPVRISRGATSSPRCTRKLPGPWVFTELNCSVEDEIVGDRSMPRRASRPRRTA